MANDRIKLDNGQVVKVALEPVYTYLKANNPEVLTDANFTALLVAQRGGTQNTDNWLLDAEGNKVGRSCAILGAYYLHTVQGSHFYKNGSYHIVIEKLKNTQLKAHKADQAEQLAKLEDDMMEDIITPKEWKQAKDEVLKDFVFSIDEDTKAELIELTRGYATKDDLAEAINNGTDVSFEDIEDSVNSYVA